MKAHGLLERIGRGYCYRLTDKGTKAALIFTSTTSASADRWQTRCSITAPPKASKPGSKVETAYHKADHAIQQVLDLLAA